MSDVTQILGRIEAGDPSAARQLMPLVYDELRRLAAARLAGERPDHTLQATALVHEAYLRLVGSDQKWESRGHFFAAAAESMRRILVDWARSRKRLKRGGDRRRVEIDEVATVEATDPDMILDLDEAITELVKVDAEAAELVKLRLFSGLSVSDAGRMLGLSRRAAYEIWDFARAWFVLQCKSPAD